MMRVEPKQLNKAGGVWFDRDSQPVNVERAWQKSDRRIALTRREQALLAAAGMDGPEARWYVLEVMRGKDIPVHNALTVANVESWMPAELVKPQYHGGRKGPRSKELLMPFLPGYVFVNVVSCAPCWAGLLGVKHVRAVVGGAERPKPVNDKDIMRLRAFVEKDPEAMRVLTRALSRGDNIRVESGPFASFPGVIDRVFDNGRALVEVMIFGRTTRVDMGLAQISKRD